MAKKTLTRQDLRQAVFHEVGLSNNECGKLVERILENISDALISGEEVKISNFGSFKLRDKPERMGRNPKTNVPAAISARRVVTFRPSKKFKAAIEMGNKSSQISE